MASSSSYAPQEPPFWPPAPHEWRWPAPQELSTHPDAIAAAAAASPASSPDSGSGSLSPASGPLRGASGRGGARRGSIGGRRGRLADGPRQSASQREKLRMRRLAGALHTLRAFLPPALAPAGRPLTKLQTLRLASRYIAHLHRLLLGPTPPTPPTPPPPAHHHWPPPTTPAAAAAAAAAAQPAPSPPPVLAAQGLPAELLAWLEGLLSPGEAHD